MECHHLMKIKASEFPVPCGKCFACLSNRQFAWSFRLDQELKVSSGAAFITLTYHPHTLPTINGTALIGTLLKSDPQKFMKKLRKLQKTKIKYYMVGEYGKKTKRPHYHYILFNLEKKNLEKIHKTWGLGNIKIDPVTPSSIHYVTGYLTHSMKFDTAQIIQRPYAAMSKGLGENYLINLKYHKENQRHYVQTKNGKQPLPVYYRNKIFTTSEKSIHQEKMAEHMAKHASERYDKFLKSSGRVNNIYIEDEQRRNDQIEKLNKSTNKRKL